MKSKSVIFQPYYTWPGHFQQYADNLKEQDDILLKLNDIKRYNNFWQYCYLRFKYSLMLLFRLFFIFRHHNKIDVNRVFIVDYEPLSFLLFSRFLLCAKCEYIITVHAVGVNKYNSRLKQFVANVQRVFLKYSLLFINDRFYCKFVVHTHTHKEQLLSLLDYSGSRCISKTNSIKVSVVEYPAPIPLVYYDYKIPLSSPLNLLVFGAIRVDKSLSCFLDVLSSINLDVNIVFAGKVYDDKFSCYDFSRLKMVKIIDRFISQDELSALARNCHFFLVPYGKEYNGGAGPIKDATCFGKPIIASNIEVFKDYSSSSFMFLYDDFLSFCGFLLDNLTDSEYMNMCRSSYSYAESNNWLNLRRNYNVSIGI